MKYDPSFFLRLGLAFIFIYAAVSAFFNPESWIGFVPKFIGNTITRGYFLFVHDLINLGLGLWLLSGKKVFYAAVISCLMLAGIILSNLSSFLITFRDIGLLLAAVALAVMSYKKN
ncbi:MAG: hypothetical protein AABY15_02415 [Nanoarchaeota archaeon]